VAVVNLRVRVAEENVVRKQDGAGFNRGLGMPEEDVVGKTRWREM
jgi:hypothetical protein